MRSEEDSAGQETPRHHRPAARDADPLLPGIAHDQRSQGKRERHGEAYVAQVKHGRMNHHLGILQQRVKPRAVGGKRASHQRERMSGKIQQQEEEDLNCSDDGGSIGKQPGIRLMSQPQHQSVGRQQQRPEQQRPFLPRPQRGELVGRGEIAITVMVDVSNGEIVLESGGHQHGGREKYQGKSRNTRSSGGFAQSLRTRTGLG